MSHGREQLPDISAFDLGLSFERRNSRDSENSEVVNRTESENVHNAAIRQGASPESQTVSAPSGAAQTVQSGRISASENQDSSSRGAAGVARETTNESADSRSGDNISADSAEVDSLRTLMEQAEREKQAAQKVSIKVYGYTSVCFQPFLQRETTQVFSWAGLFKANNVVS